MTEERKASRWPAAFLAVTTCLFAPALVYYGNPDEFEYFFAHAALWLVPAAAAVAVAVARICRGRPGVQVLVAAVAACEWAQLSALTWDYGVLDGTPIRWERFGPWRGIADASVWIAVLAAALWARRRVAGRRVAAASAFFVALELLTIGALAAPRLFDGTTFKRYRMESAGALDFSSRQFVLVLVLDSFQSGAFERIVQADPSLAAAFDGFTFFPDATGGFPSTYPSVPLILTGQAFDNTRSIQDFVEQAYRTERSLPALLRRAGYRVDLFPLAPQTVALDPAMAANVRPRLAATWEELAPLLKTAAFRALPHPAKRSLAAALLERRPFRHSSAILTFAAELESMPPANVEEPVFKLLHLSGAHPPFEVNERLEPEALGSDLRAYDRQAAGVLRLTGRFLQKLREGGAYDNALILVLGDHGHALGGLVELGTPLVLVKTPRAHGPLKTSDRPVALGDVPPTVADALGLPGWDDPSARSMLRPGPAERDRRFLSYAWDHRFWAREARYLPSMSEYLIRGPASQEQSWIKTGWRYESGRAIPPRPYAWGTELGFGRAAAAPASTYQAGSGWWSPEDEHTWSKRSASLHLPVEPRGGALELEATLIPFLAPSQAEQVVTVRANGEGVAVWRLGAPGTVRARIPEAVAGAGHVLCLDFSSAEAHSPAEVGLGADGRELGVAFIRAKVTPAP
jgi:hypothetical protein